MTPVELVAVLRAARLAATTEAKLQLAIAAALQDARVEFKREARLAPGERIDFLAGDVGIEAKVRCDRRKIYRQLERYARIDDVGSLILVTGTAMGLPADIDGKPLFYVSIGRTGL